MNNLLRKQSKNNMTPQLIATILMKDKHMNHSGMKFPKRSSEKILPKKALFQSLIGRGEKPDWEEE